MRFLIHKYRKQLKICIAMLLFGLLSALPVGQVCAETDVGNSAKSAEEAAAEPRTYVVSQDGTGDFTTIQACVDAASSGDMIYVLPGIYEESVEIFNKTISLIGWDRDTCIIKYNASRYAKAPLTFSAGDVENLTIYGYGGDIQREAYGLALAAMYDDGDSTVDEITQWQSKFSGYAVHIDSNYLYGKHARMKNCKIITNNNYCVGIGGRGESEVVLEQCELVSNGTGGCIYYHNTDEETVGGEARFTVRGCMLKNYKCPYVISIHSMSECNPVYLTFQNTQVRTVAYEARHVYNSTNMNIMFDIDTMEALENADALYTSGYSTSAHAKLITHYDAIKSHEYMKALVDNVSETVEAPQLGEGITYITAVDMDAYYLAQESRPDVKQRKRCEIDIFNKN